MSAAYNERQLYSRVKLGLKFILARVRMALGLAPLSYVWAIDRGWPPIHRYFVEVFLEKEARAIHGHCLEFQDPFYVPRLGGDRVSKLDILHLDTSSPHATLVADLTAPNSLISDTFDCIVCIHVLHVIYDVRSAVKELFRILKPGGVLLVAVPQVSMCEPRYGELWRFTPEGLRQLLAEAFGADSVAVAAYGNSLTSAGEIRGLLAREFLRYDLNHHDPRFAVEVCARATKV